MDIENIAGQKIFIHDVTVRLNDHITDTVAGSRGIIFGSGTDTSIHTFNFKNIFEFDAFVETLLVARNQLPVEYNSIKNIFQMDKKPYEYARVIIHNIKEDEYYEECSECHSKEVSLGDNYCSNCGVMFIKDYKMKDGEI